MKKDQRICAAENCNTNISHLRANALTCSPNCKKAHQRQMKKAQKFTIASVTAFQEPIQIQNDIAKNKVCAAPSCGTRVHFSKTYCSNKCKQKAYRMNNPKSLQKQEKSRTKRIYELNAILTATYHSLPTIEAKREMLARTVRVAVKGTRHDELLKDFATYRRLLRSKLFAAKDDEFAKLRKIKGQTSFAVIANEYIFDVYHMFPTDFFKSPDTPPAVDPNSWNEGFVFDDEEDTLIENDDVVSETKADEPTPAEPVDTNVIAYDEFTAKRLARKKLSREMVKGPIAKPVIERDPDAKFRIDDFDDSDSTYELKN